MNVNQTILDSCGKTMFRLNEHAVTPLHMRHLTEINSCIYGIVQISATTLAASCGNSQPAMWCYTNNRHYTCCVILKFAVTCVISCRGLLLHIRHHTEICNLMYTRMANVLTMHKVAIGDVLKEAKHQYPYSCLMLRNTDA